MQGNAPDEEYVNPHGECAARIHQLEDALRLVTTVRLNKPDGVGGYILEKSFCEICEAECGPDQEIVHVGDCPLSVLSLVQAGTITTYPHHVYSQNDLTEEQAAHLIIERRKLSEPSLIQRIVAWLKGEKL